MNPLVGEVECLLGVHRDEVDVRMRDIEPEHGYPYTFATESGLLRASHTLREAGEAGKSFGVEVEEIICLDLWHAEGMTRGEGVDIEEGVVLGILSYLVGGDFAVYYLGEKCWHGCMVLIDGECDVEDLEGHEADGDTNLDFLADLLADEAFGDRGGEGDLTSLEVGAFGLGDDGVGHLGVGLGVENGDTAEELDGRGVELRGVYDSAVGDCCLELHDFGFEMCLSLFGGIILGVLGEVAFVARLGYGRDDFRTLDALECGEFVFHFLETGLCDVVYVCHGLFLIK